MVGNAAIVIGAYGREYHDFESAEKDWKAGKDFFLLPHRTYCSIRDFTILDHALVMFKDNVGHLKQGAVFGEEYYKSREKDYV